MKRFLTILTALVASGLALPKLLIDGRVTPDMSCPAVVDAWARIEDSGRLYHDLKNLTTEMVRCDAQWFAKASAFVILYEAIVIAALIYWIISMRTKNAK